MAQRIPITQGNDFEVRLRPILMDGTIVDASLLTDRVVKVKHGITETTYTSTVDEDYICIAFDSTLQLGDYSVKITAKLGDQDVAANYGNLFSIVPFGMATPIVPVKGDLVIIGVSDEETEAYRQALVDAKDNYNTAAEALEDAKEELEEQAEALTDIAKESTLNNPTYGLQAIKTAIGNIPGGGGGGGGVTKAEVQDIIDEQTDTLEDDIDDVLTAATAAKTAAEAIVIPSNIATSANFEGLAQEGTSVAILESLGTDDDESVHDKLDSFAQELDKIGTPAEGQPSTLFEAIAEGGGGGSEHTTDEVYELLEDAINKKNSIGGLTFQAGNGAVNVVDSIIKKSLVTEVYDDEIEVISTLNAFSGFSSIKILEMTALNSITSYQTWYQCTNLLYAKLPNLESVMTGSQCHIFSCCSSLKEAYLPKLTNFGAYAFYNCGNLRKLVTALNQTPYSNNVNTLSGCTNLIDFTMRPSQTMSISAWNPTNALLADSTSLVEDGEEFTSNLEKFLYCVREHIAANLPTMSATITFSSAVKAAINADAITLAAFTSKGWTIA